MPLDLADAFTTKTGKPRTEWKFSLGTKDRDDARRSIPAHIQATDDLILKARASAVVKGSRTTDSSIGAQADEDARGRSIVDLPAFHAILKDIMEEREEVAEAFQNRPTLPD